jgi:cell division protein FtsZ
VLLSIAGGSDLGLFEINEAASLVQEAAHPEANIIFGTVIDDSLGDEVRVTVIAAGFEAGGPTHKKLEPTPFRSPEKPSSGVIAPGVSGSTSTGNGYGSAPQEPARPPAPAPAASSNGSGGIAPPPSAPAPAPAPLASPHQSGTLPPAAPLPGSAAASGAPYAPPAPRRPETARREYGYDTTEPVRQQPPPVAPPAVVERPAPSYAQPMDAVDLDDDVDVPPFMKR